VKKAPLIYLLILLSFSIPTLANRLVGVKMGNDRLVVEFEKPISEKDIRFFTLKGRVGAVRYVFDFKNTAMKYRKMGENLRYDKSRIASIRLAQYKKDTFRIVIEAVKNYIIKHYKADSTTYVITLPPGTRDISSSIKGLFASLGDGAKKLKEKLEKRNDKGGGGAKALEMIEDRPKNSSSATKSGKSVLQSSKKSIRAMHKPVRSTKKVTDSAYIIGDVTPRPKKRYRIVIDPGHGGHDSGAVDGTKKYYEKRAVLAIALRLREHLKNMGFSVLMTRSDDRFVKLSKRTRYANRKSGDVFVSIHANAVPRRKWKKSHGIETYFLQVTRSERAKRVAARENSVVLNRKDRLSKNVILNAIYTGPKIVLSNKLAIDVQKSILHNLRKRYKNVKDGGVRPAPFWVLVGAEMPAILIETGYITHPMEKKRLYDPKYQDLMAKGIAMGIARYLANREKEIE